MDSKSAIKLLYDVILTSKKSRKGKISIYRLQKMHITSEKWRHFLSNFFEKLNLSSSYEGLSPHQIWRGLIWVKESKVAKGGGRTSASQVENVLNRPDEIGLRKMPLTFLLFDHEF